jgi:hypothetical protein
MWNLIQMNDGGLGHAVSKMINSPDLCDKVCMEAAVWLSVVMGMIIAIFPVPEETDANTASETTK